MSACRSWLQRWRIRRHFAQTIRPDAERLLRSHLTSCLDCRAYYDARLLFSELDPQGKPAIDRLAGGLGLTPRSSSMTAPLMLAAAACACAAILWLRAPHDTAPEFAARGSVSAQVHAQLRAYRNTAHGSEPVSAFIQRDEELSFAYVNPEGYAYLLVLGVDERGQIFWYYPGWTDPATTPAAVPIEKSATLVELPDAVRHSLAGNKLELLAIFSDTALSVREVEDRIGSPGARVGPLFTGTLEQTLPLEVR
jgi:hypothetical protein